MVRGFAALAIVAAIGCSGGGGDLIEVTGTVATADGAPLKFESGKVMFQPDGEGQSASGSVAQDGTFTMMTKVPGDGVVPGHYKVLIQLWKNYRAGTQAISKKYSDAATTPIQETVDADHAHFDFKVEPGP